MCCQVSEGGTKIRLIFVQKSTHPKENNFIFQIDKVQKSIHFLPLPLELDNQYCHKEKKGIKDADVKVTSIVFKIHTVLYKQNKFRLQHVVD